MMTSDFLTSVERNLPYAKYFYRDTLPPTDRQLAILNGEPLDVKDMLPIEDRMQLFDATPTIGDMGYGIMPNGTGYVANVTETPDITPEMFYWWFAWHGLEDLRYKIWFPEAHLYARTQNIEQALDETLPMNQRIWDTTHVISENVVAGAEEIILDYLSPDRMGFDETRLDADTAMVCANGRTKVPGQGLDCVNAQILRKGKNGYEIRSQFWIGYQIRNGRVEQVNDESVCVSLESAKSMFAHCREEYAGLSMFLPSLFKELGSQSFL